MRYLLLFISITFISAACYAQEINQQLLKKHIEFLASDKLKGRGTSTKQEKKAAAYIANKFETIGLQPKGTNGYYFDFTFKKNINPHDTNAINVKLRKGRNVVAYLDNKAELTVIIGAHYDHLGLGRDHNSLDANPAGKIHNGADDNASGTAGVLALADYFAKNNIKEKFNFLFICFSGEELGLLGSKKYCDNPTIDFTRVNYMVNMDMIGRLNDSTNKLIIYGVGTSPTWVPLIDRTADNFSIKKDSSGIGPSDQTSFYLKDMPVLHFFTGQHSDYHKPGDDAGKINYPGEAKVLGYIIKLIFETEKMPKLLFTKTKSQETKSTKFKVTMGVMPDYAFEGKGMRIDGVSDGKPAAKAGVLKGDVIIQIGDKRVNNVQDYMEGLSAYSKGDTAQIKVVRNLQEIELKVTF